ncbi:STAS domain-containing protein [Azoarcus sp. KH32C]|uniref:STAS domain-containing protein n=1 Tax=Azoarcus sp. KH32C TaxID=748247 RepID=UPI0002386DA1|nr:STAS domain-containing protein [Azoarcus sp. KH32C]BAL24412.1 anti-sigma factor antagonist containing STAS domain/sulfate transporter [Azoarcus sp. KH32C]
MTVRLTRQDNQAILAIHGRFDFSLHAEFRKCSEEALNLEDARQIVVNLSRVDYLDSSALGMLLLLREKAAGNARSEVVLSGARGMVKQVLEVANFGRMFRID